MFLGNYSLADTFAVLRELGFIQHDDDVRFWDSPKSYEDGWPKCQLFVYKNSLQYYVVDTNFRYDDYTWCSGVANDEDKHEFIQFLNEHCPDYR